jgi:hypothetical protein
VDITAPAAAVIDKHLQFTAQQARGREEEERLDLFCASKYQSSF